MGYTGGLIGVENYWPVGNATGFVRKFDAAGTLQWERLFDTAGIDIVEAATVAPDGVLFVAGRTSGAFAGYANSGQLDLFVASLSSDGEVLDVLEQGDERPQHPVAIASVGNGSIVVAGYDDVWVVGNAVMDWQNESIAQFFADATGKLSGGWSYRSHVLDWDVSTGVAGVGDGSGDFFISRYDGSASVLGGGLFVDRLSANGSAVWDAKLSASHVDYIVGVSMSATGRVYAAGTTYESSTSGGLTLGGADGFIVELDPATGAEKWARPFGSAGSEWVTSFSMDRDGNLVLAGYSDGAVQPGHTVLGEDPFAMLISPDGNVIGAWQGTALWSDDTFSAARGCGDSFALSGSVDGIDPAATLGRTDAELTMVAFTRLELILRNGFEVAN